MNYIGNLPNLEIIQEFSHKFDYIKPSNPGVSENPATPWALWLNYVTGTLFVCVNNTPNSNLWEAINSRSVQGGLAYISSWTHTSSGNWLSIDFSGVVYDHLGMWDVVVPSRFTIPANVQFVQLTAMVGWGGYASVTNRGLLIGKNGLGAYAGRPITLFPNQTGNEAYCSAASAPIPVVEGDYFQLFAFQNTGANLALNASNGAWLSIQVLQ